MSAQVKNWIAIAADRIETLSHDKVAAGSYIGEAEIIQIVEACIKVYAQQPPRCDRCVYWRRHDWSEDNTGMCFLEREKPVETRMYTGDLPVSTYADFGCVQFEAKE